MLQGLFVKQLVSLLENIALRVCNVHVIHVTITAICVLVSIHDIVHHFQDVDFLLLSFLFLYLMFLSS